MKKEWCGVKDIQLLKQLEIFEIESHNVTLLSEIQFANISLFKIVILHELSNVTFNKLLQLLNALLKISSILEKYTVSIPLSTESTTHF